MNGGKNKHKNSKELEVDRQTDRKEAAAAAALGRD